MTSLCEKILITDVLKLFDYHDIYIWVVLRDDRISWHRYLNRKKNYFGTFILCQSVRVSC